MSWLRIALAPLAFAASTALLVPLLAGRDAQRIDDGGAPVRALAHTVAERAVTGFGPVGPGHPTFDGEWKTVTGAFGALGLALTAERYPDRVDHDALLAGARASLQAIQTDEARSFASTQWGVDGGRDLDHGGGHAWLGYEALGLAVSHRAFPEDTWIAERHRAVHQGLIHRLQRHTPASLATYPGHTFPPDQAVVLAALELGGHDTSAWRSRWFAESVDADTGLLIQRRDADSGVPVDLARGSGTALAAWALGLAELPEGASLWRALDEHLLVEQVGIAAIREVAPGDAPRADIDSGPVIMGFGLSASGFALGASRAHGRRHTFTRLHRLAWVVGAPAEAGGARRWVGGGAVGDAILLAAEATPLGGAR